MKQNRSIFFIARRDCMKDLEKLKEMIEKIQNPHKKMDYQKIYKDLTSEYNLIVQKRDDPNIETEETDMYILNYRVEKYIKNIDNIFMYN